jgi:Spy/CpxP family protein refolding chaperone
MLGFLFGALCLVGLFKVLRYGRRGYGGGGRCGGGFGHHGGWGPGRGWGEGGGWGGGFGPRVLLRSLFERLDATPGQEKVILSAVDEMREAGQKLKSEIRSSREEVARVTRGEIFDAESLGELFAKHDSALEELRKVAVGAMARVHDALDSRQRERLAEMIESGFGRFGGPRAAYRT